jgi:hypothetical protein
LGGIGRFQVVNNTIRYIIGDKNGILAFINLVSGKLRTPKNYSINKLIEFFNTKYSLKLALSIIDKSDLATNAWFAGFTEADGHFGVKCIDFKPKSELRKRSTSSSISLKFVLGQRLIDKVTSLSMLDIMKEISSFLSCELYTYKTKENKDYICINITSIERLKLIVNYFDKYPLLGTKSEDYKD